MVEAEVVEEDTVEAQVAEEDMVEVEEAVDMEVAEAVVALEVEDTAETEAAAVYMGVEDMAEGEEVAEDLEAVHTEAAGVGTGAVEVMAVDEILMRQLELALNSVIDVSQNK
ncbi:uncharacterized protein LOC135209030 [Macrobrachium nipponense]|uniref:uncharacterized protein LOC135209030 n=1 Tax=Macrobrachium nipponense TaxID=159736 RepID=UPI0030C7D5B9